MQRAKAAPIIIVSIATGRDLQSLTSRATSVPVRWVCLYIQTHRTLLFNLSSQAFSSQHGNVECERRPCPPLNCTNSYTPPGECCPKCPGTQINQETWLQFFSSTTLSLHSKTFVYLDLFQTAPLKTVYLWMERLFPIPWVCVRSVHVWAAGLTATEHNALSLTVMHLGLEHVVRTTAMVSQY